MLHNNTSVPGTEGGEGSSDQMIPLRCALATTLDATCSTQCNCGRVMRAASRDGCLAARLPRLIRRTPKADGRAKRALRGGAGSVEIVHGDRNMMVGVVSEP